MSLRQARCEFTKAIAALIRHANALGYEVALDEGMERLTAKDPTSDHMPNSLHHIGLAQDINLYRDGVYLSTTEDHRELGEWWEKLGETMNLPLCWGGRFKSPDGNHYSHAYEGRK
jgi:hypothetical protein